MFRLSPFGVANTIPYYSPRGGSVVVVVETVEKVEVELILVVVVDDVEVQATSVPLGQPSTKVRSSNSAYPPLLPLSIASKAISVT